MRPGRPPHGVARAEITPFQSAPRPCGRGDITAPDAERAAASFNPRPDRAAGATMVPFLREPLLASFNPRPDRAAGATLSSGGSPHRPRVSIRAPTVRPGRLIMVAPIPHQSVVSIRAPTVRPGRPGRHRCQRELVRFQSAPRPCGRGDSRPNSATRGASQFQSAPRPCGRGDTWQRYNSARSRSFQSAPRPCGRGDSVHLF